MKMFSTVAGFFCMTTQQRTKMVSRTSRGPWAGQDGPKRREEHPKSRQNRPQAPPRSASGRPKRCLGALPERSCRPSGAPQELPGGLQEVILDPSGLDFGPCGGRFARPRPLNVRPGSTCHCFSAFPQHGPRSPPKLEHAQTRTRQHKRITTCQENTQTMTPPTEAIQTTAGHEAPG